METVLVTGTLFRPLWARDKERKTEKFGLPRISIFLVTENGCFMEFWFFSKWNMYWTGCYRKGGYGFNRHVLNIKISGDIMRREKITDVIGIEQKKFPFREYKIPLQSVSYFEPLRSSIWAHGERLLANL